MDTSTGKNITTSDGANRYPTVPGESNLSTLAIELLPVTITNPKACIIYATIVGPDINGTIWSRAGADCDVSSADFQGKVGQRLLVPMDVIGMQGSQLNYSTVNLTVVIVATAEPKCSLV